jgi:hypothetical protein
MNEEKSIPELEKECMELLEFKKSYCRYEELSDNDMIKIIEEVTGNIFKAIHILNKRSRIYVK